MVSRVEVRSDIIWLDGDGIVHSEVKPHIELTVEDAREVLEQIRLLSGGKRRPVLVDLTHCKAVSREARAHYAGEQGSQAVLAAALLTGSPMARVIGNFFLEINKPIFPVRLFTSEAQALAWLKSFLQ